MKLQQSMLLDLECVLRMHQIRAKSTALIIGYVRKADFTSPPDFDFLAYFICKLFDLRRRGITTFIFSFWGYFEQVFFEALSLHGGSKDRYLFIGADSFAAGIPTDHRFEAIITTSDMVYADDDELAERVLLNCSTLAHYNTKDIIEQELIIRMAQKKKNILLDMDLPTE